MNRTTASLHSHWDCGKVFTYEMNAPVHGVARARNSFMPPRRTLFSESASCIELRAVNGRLCRQALPAVWYSLTGDSFSKAIVDIEPTKCRCMGSRPQVAECRCGYTLHSPPRGPILDSEALIDTPSSLSEALWAPTLGLTARGLSSLQLCCSSNTKLERWERDRVRKQKRVYQPAVALQLEHQLVQLEMRGNSDDELCESC